MEELGFANVGKGDNGNISEVEITGVCHLDTLYLTEEEELNSQQDGKGDFISESKNGFSKKDKHIHL